MEMSEKLMIGGIVTLFAVLYIGLQYLSHRQAMRQVDRLSKEFDAEIEALRARNEKWQPHKT